MIDTIESKIYTILSDRFNEMLETEGGKKATDDIVKTIVCVNINILSMLCVDLCDEHFEQNLKMFCDTVVRYSKEHRDDILKLQKPTLH